MRPCAASPGSGGGDGVGVQFRLYQQSGSGKTDQSLRRVALNGAALDKVRDTTRLRRLRAKWIKNGRQMH